jgi:prevent-host-death family protein
MSYSENIKPISYLKANAAKIACELKEDGKPYTITQNGEAAMVVQSVREYEQTQESLAMLKMINQGARDFENNEYLGSDQAIQRIKDRLGI